MHPAAREHGFHMCFPQGMVNLKGNLAEMKPGKRRTGPVQSLPIKVLLLDLPCRQLAQGMHDKNRLQSINEPDAECTSKGEIRQRSEFGRKAGNAMADKMGIAITPVRKKKVDIIRITYLFNDILLLLAWRTFHRAMSRLA